jgi:SOS response regulatory protein OraA/RecX
LARHLPLRRCFSTLNCLPPPCSDPRASVTPSLRGQSVANPTRFLYSGFVLGRSRKLETETELYEAAQLALMRRPHSVSEMKKLLLRRSANELLVQEVMARLKENGLIDDARYAKQFTRQRTEIRRQGKYRIARELRSRGVSDRHIESALADARDDDAERAAIRQRINRKLKSRSAQSASVRIDDRKIASLYRSLLRAGFPSDAIRGELKSLTTEDVPEIDPDSALEA